MLDDGPDGAHPSRRPSSGFDEDATHYMSVAVRESVVNAIKHGNGMNEAKRVAVSPRPRTRAQLEVEVQDQGPGFDPDSVPTPWPRRTC